MITYQKQYDDNKLFSKFIRFLKEHNAYICWKKKEDEILYKIKDKWYTIMNTLKKDTKSSSDS